MISPTDARRDSFLSLCLALSVAIFASACEPDCSKIEDDTARCICQAQATGSDPCSAIVTCVLSQLGCSFDNFKCVYSDGGSVNVGASGEGSAGLAPGGSGWVNVSANSDTTVFMSFDGVSCGSDDPCSPFGLSSWFVAIGALPSTNYKFEIADFSFEFGGLNYAYARDPAMEANLEAAYPGYDFFAIGATASGPLGECSSLIGAVLQPIILDPLGPLSATTPVILATDLPSGTYSDWSASVSVPNSGFSSTVVAAPLVIMESQDDDIPDHLTAELGVLWVDQVAVFNRSAGASQVDIFAEVSDRTTVMVTEFVAGSLPVDAGELLVLTDGWGIASDFVPGHRYELTLQVRDSQSGSELSRSFSDVLPIDDLPEGRLYLHHDEGSPGKLFADFYAEVSGGPNLDGHDYVMVLSLGGVGDGYEIAPGMVLPMEPDGWTTYFLSLPPGNALFTDYRGALGSQGVAHATLDEAGLEALLGPPPFTVTIAAWANHPSTGDIEVISNAVTWEVQQ